MFIYANSEAGRAFVGNYSCVLNKFNREVQLDTKTNF